MGGRPRSFHTCNHAPLDPPTVPYVAQKSCAGADAGCAGDGLRPSLQDPISYLHLTGARVRWGRGVSSSRLAPVPQRASDHRQSLTGARHRLCCPAAPNHLQPSPSVARRRACRPATPNHLRMSPCAKHRYATHRHAPPTHLELCSSPSAAHHRRMPATWPARVGQPEMQEKGAYRGYGVGGRGPGGWGRRCKICWSVQ
jgi:hypothetical protein